MREQVVAGADLEGALVAGRERGLRRRRRRRCSAARAVRSLGRQLVADPDLLSRQRDPVAAGRKQARRRRQAGRRCGQRETGQRSSKPKDALRRTFNRDFLTESDATDPSAVGVWGALKGSFLTIIVTMLLAFPIGVLAGGLSRGIRAAGTAGPTRSRCRSTISPRCRRSSSACSASRCSSTSCTCRARRRWSAG